MQFTIRRMLLGPALLGMLLAWIPQFAGRFGLQFDLYDYRYVEEKLTNPTEFLGLEQNHVVLAGGRYLEVEATTWRDRDHPATSWKPVDLKLLIDGLYDEARLQGDANLVELQPAPDGRTLLYVRKGPWFCGTRPVRPLVHVPLFRRTIYIGHRVLIGVGTLRRR